MTNKEIFHAAKSNDIKKLIRAIKEPHQVHHAEYLTQQMYLHDMEEIKNILNEANQLILEILDAIEKNSHIRGDAHLLLKEQFRYEFAIEDKYWFWDEAGWQDVIYCELCQRHLGIETIDVNSIENLYEQAQNHRLRTIISQVGIKNILHKMNIELEKITLDTDNLEYMIYVCRKFVDKKEDGILLIKKLMMECLKNRLYINEGRINQRYFTRVGEINAVMNYYFRRGE